MIKNYTSIEQSKKLAEIPPIESADMLYYCSKESNTLISESPFTRSFKETNTFSYVLCWSLAALLSVLPYNYIDDNDTVCHPNLIKTKDGRYMVIYNVSQYTSLCNNPVDACVEMIIHLNELKML